MGKLDLSYFRRNNPKSEGIWGDQNKSMISLFRNRAYRHLFGAQIIPLGPDRLAGVRWL